MHEHEPSVLATLAQQRSNFVRIDDSERKSSNSAKTFKAVKEN